MFPFKIRILATSVVSCPSSPVTLFSKNLNCSFNANVTVPSLTPSGNLIFARSVTGDLAVNLLPCAEFLFTISNEIALACVVSAGFTSAVATSSAPTNGIAIGANVVNAANEAPTLKRLFFIIDNSLL